jgi:predicted DNA-binding transcriptional regulator YafY
MTLRLTHLHYVYEIIKNNAGISKADLLHKLGVYSSPATALSLERDLGMLREQYGVEIVFNAATQRYTLNENADANLRTFENFAKTQVLGGMLDDMLNKGVRVWDVVDVDDQVPIMQVEHIKNLIEAILDRKRVKVTYRKFFEKANDVYELEPQFIRQSQKRWYLIAGDTSTAPPTIKLYGIERIISVERLTTPFKPGTKAIKERFKGVYGVSEYYKDKEKVVLETNHYQGKYFETLPVHTSQQVEYLTGDRCRITLFVVPNKELLQLLVSQLQPIKVLAPEALKADYRAFVERKFKDLD